MKYVAPKSGLEAFTCPFCGVYSRQIHRYSTKELEVGMHSNVDKNPVRVNECEHCHEICLWYYSTMVYPQRGNAPNPNNDMPNSVKKDYEEAASIYNRSPRGAAALLRLAIQKLCKELGGKGDDLNKDIAILVKKGLPVNIQQAMDVVRVIGNNAVHPGQIDVDDEDVVNKLFSLINLIVDYMISMPNSVNGLFNNLPAGIKKQIKDRDENK